ncbi:ABC transporter permease [bacterium]|nr:MAG: ABC transporter permease [bacterium]
MNQILTLTNRNFKLFLRNKSAVFFSFLSVLIILVLYILFLGKTQVDAVKSTIGNVVGIENLVNSWLMAGIIFIATVTVAFGVLSRFVEDREDKKTSDFLVTPVNRIKIVFSYVLSTVTISSLLSIILFLLAEIYIISQGGSLLSSIRIIEMLILIVVSSILSSTILLFIISYLRNMQSVGIINGIMSAFLGFLSGVYMPIGIMPNFAQTIANILPTSHIASIARQIFLDDSIKKVFNNAPTNIIDTYRKTNGIDLYFLDHKISFGTSFLIIVITIIIFTILNIVRFRKLKD